MHICIYGGKGEQKKGMKINNGEKTGEKKEKGKGK